MKKIATGAVFAALVLSSVSPAFAAVSRPKAATIDSSLLATTVPVSFAATSSDSGTTSSGIEQPTSSTANDPTLYSGLLAYFKADLDFEGAVYQGLQDAGVSTAALTKAYGKLNAATLNLIAYLETTLSEH